MAKHTKGPWMKIGGGIYQADYVGRREVVHGSGIKGRTPEEKAANAALMAAAPEMLEACEAALSLTRWTDRNPMPSLQVERMLRDTIAKAKGQQDGQL
jgi:hypothetical protein